MKKIIIFTCLLATATGLKAQSVQGGNNYLYYERYASAENTFSQLVKVDPANADAWFGLVKTYLLTNKDSVAATALASAPVKLKEQPMFEVATGWSLLA